MHKVELIVCFQHKVWDTYVVSIPDDDPRLDNTSPEEVATDEFTNKWKGDPIAFIGIYHMEYEDNEEVKGSDSDNRKDS